MPTAQTPGDLPSPDLVLSMSGLDFMRRMLAGDITLAPIAGVLNYRIHDVEPGRVAFRGTPGFEACNTFGAVHGGWYGTIMDTCMGSAVMTAVPKGSVYTTLEYKVNITRPVPRGMEVEAVGTLHHGGRSTGVAMGEMRGVEDGRLYATGSTTCIIMAKT